MANLNVNSGLFLDGIFNDGDDNNEYISPNKLILRFSEYDGTTNVPVRLAGLLASEPSISTQNKWGPLLENYASLNDINNVVNIMGDQNMFSWVGASVMVWKGTEPIKLNLDFYLINYKRGLNLESKLKSLTKLTALAGVDSKLSAVQVAVHGGYKANQILNTNTQMMGQNQTYVDNSNVSLDDFSKATGFGNKDVDSKLESIGRGSLSDPVGTLSLEIGHKVSIRNLLVGRVDTTPSLVEVADGKALYYRVNLSLTGVRPLVTTDVDSMYH